MRYTSNNLLLCKLLVTVFQKIQERERKVTSLPVASSAQTCEMGDRTIGQIGQSDKKKKKTSCKTIQKLCVQGTRRRSQEERCLSDAPRSTESFFIQCQVSGALSLLSSARPKSNGLGGGDAL